MLTREEDPTKDLRKYQIKNDNKDLAKIKFMVKDTMNPFDSNIDKEELHTLGTGKAVNKDTEEFLLNITSMGEMSRKAFIAECNHDASRFEQPIKKNKLLTFVTKAGRHVYLEIYLEAFYHYHLKKSRHG